MAGPWLKFYPRDWRGDQALRVVSVAARGLWIECLCIMHEARPYGHLVLNGNPVEGDALARMTGIPVDEVSALMSELRQAGVLSVTSKGVVFSRRMTRDHARAQKGRRAIQKRWSQAVDDVQQSSAPNRIPNRSPITQKPEAREQIGDKPSSTAIPPIKIIPQKTQQPRAVAGATRTGGPDFFEGFWKAYPKRGEASNPKKPARDKFARLLKAGVEPKEIIEGASRYRDAERRANREGTEKVAQAITWLNQERWRDYLERLDPSEVPSQPVAPDGAPSDAELRERYGRQVRNQQSSHGDVLQGGGEAHGGGERLQSSHSLPDYQAGAARVPGMASVFRPAFKVSSMRNDDGSGR